MVITPPHMHMHVEVLLRAGMLALITVGDPGAQGAVVAGIHGMGVNTPKAAAVAAATVGLAGHMHMAKGMIFNMGTKSMIFATGMFEHMVLFTGRTVKAPGAAPKLHINEAPLTTRLAMMNSYSFSSGQIPGLFFKHWKVRHRSHIDIAVVLLSSNKLIWFVQLPDET